MTEDNKLPYREIWKNRLGVLPKAFRLLTIIFAAVVVVYLVLDQIMWRRVVAQRQVFLEKFGGVEFEDFRPQRPPPHEDAGRVYSYAIALIAKANARYGGWEPLLLLVDQKYAAEMLHLDHSPTREEIVPLVRERLLAMQGGLDLVREASLLNQGSTITNSDPELTMRTLAQARVLARKIAAKARVVAIDGNTEEAFEWVTAGLHFANSFRNEPTIICQMFRFALTGIAVSAAREILDVSDDSPPISDSLRRELDIARRQQDFIRVLAGEVAGSRTRYRTHYNGIRSLRLLASTRELELNHFLFDLADAMQEDVLTERREALAEVAEKAESYRLTPFSTVPALCRGVARAVEIYDRNVALCDELELALALRAYKRQLGTYPDQLSLLTPTYIEVLPKDPFSGKDYLYRTENEGFLLYSVGRDLKDDGGTPMKGGAQGDIVWKTLK
ncbi:MAG: hypothetical protein IID09_03205 [Candidatus Hydrogenedentes bacterium]|nr:hypothetical protein [Candidatus Hydrogenedentota bacterium]